VLNFITISRPCIPPLVLFPNALFLALYFSFHRIHRLSQYFPPFPRITVCMQITFNFFFSFHLRNYFDSSITHLQIALQHISSVMTANLLTLGSYKTEFLLIGLKKQLATIHSSLLNATHSARNLGLIFDEQLALAQLSGQISFLSESCLLSHSSTSVYPPLPQFHNCSQHSATSIVCSKLDYCNSVYYNLRKCPSVSVHQIHESLACAVLLRFLNPIIPIH